MPNRIRATSLTEPRESGIFDAIMNKIYPKKGTFVKDDAGIYISVVDNAKWIGEINGEWIAYQTSPHFTIDDTSIGTIVEFDSKKSLERHGSKYVLPDTVYLKQEQPYLYEYYSLTRPDLIIDEYTFRTPKPFNHLKPSYEVDQIYSKGSILYIEPDTYDEITLAAGTHVNHLGKSVTYQAETKVKRYAVRLRSTKDNNTDDPVATFGTSWVIDQPNDIVEEGTNVTNSVTNKIRLYAGNRMLVTAYKTRAVGAAYRWVFPLKTVNAIPNLLTSSPFYEVGSSSSYYSTGFDNLVANTSIVVKTWIGSTSVTDPIFMSLEDIWY